MRLLPLPGAAIRLRLDHDESEVLQHLVNQLIELLQGYSGTSLDPDPLLANLEIGGSDEPPSDPALARLFPQAFEDEEDAAAFRRVTEQGLVNRKLQDAIDVTSMLALGAESLDEDSAVEVDITSASIAAWVRTLTSLRLAIAARIGLDSELDHTRLATDDEHRGTVMVFDWLGAILESVLQMAVD